MTHYQTVFNGTRMVYRKVVPKQKGGAIATPVVEGVPQPQQIEVKAAPKEDVKARRQRVGVDLLKML